ncbi:MAG TPA: dethiobiotin synthase [Solirubrobacteraceae bacterium]|jgi:dethiobiotin synthetase|nr:dethiobiotin synthase [Solirubrobacteraceae bacterium]
MSAELRGCFVTGTGTGVGKTVVAAAIVARLRALGAGVRAVKPLITGLDDPPDPDWPSDHELLARVAGSEPAEVILAGFGPAVSPHLAIELSGATPPTLEWLAGGVRALARVGGVGSITVVEGVGGLLVPLGPVVDVRDLAGALGLPLVIAARPGLGTISHTLLTLEAARAAGLTVAGVVLTPWPGQPSVMERSNRETIADRGEVEVVTLPLVARADPDLLAAAGAELPLERWLDDALR